MKRLWFAIIFIAVAIISCSYEQVVIELGYKEIVSVIDKAVVCEIPNEKIEYSSSVIDLWEKYHKKLAFVTDHSNFEEADVCISRLKFFSNDEELNNKLDDVNEVLTEAKSQIEQTYKSSKVNLSNVF